LHPFNAVTPAGIGTGGVSLSVDLNLYLTERAQVGFIADLSADLGELLGIQEHGKQHNTQCCKQMDSFHHNP
jgi:hypothetical protein